MYKVNPASYTGVFVMPSEIADKHLKLASEAMLKVILYVYRHADTPVGVPEVAAGTGLSEDEASDGLAYWCSAGVLKDADEPEKPEAETALPADIPEETAEKPEKKPVVRTKPGMLSHQQICARLSESPEVGELFRIAQEKLGRTIGTADQSALLNLHDYYGLPAEVILAICEYAATHGKSGNFNYIFTMGADWSNREIDSIEAADEELRKLEQISAVWPDFRRLTGLKTAHPTAAQHKYLDIWTGEWNFSLTMLAAAFDEMSRHTESVSFPYMNKILAGWHSAGIKTPEQAEEAKKKFDREKEEKALKKKDAKSPYGVRGQSESDRPASYDIEKATEYMNTTVPKHKKKEKR